jgi:hypothetical protein
MGSEGDIWRENRKNFKAKHAANKVLNTQEIVTSGLPHEIKNAGEHIIITAEGKPRVDFWPSSGRWQCQGRIYNGGARSFLNWYRKQEVA